MRACLILLPFAVCASPALGQAAAPADPAFPPELTDPATADRIARTVQSIADSFLDLRVGEMQAAVEGRVATPAEKRQTVRDLGRRQNPDFDRQVRQQIANTRPMIEQSMKALADALPAMRETVERAERAIERAAANMPDPTYPKR